MYLPIPVETDAQRERFRNAPGTPPLPPDALITDGADAHWLLADEHDAPVARCSLWWAAAPAYQGHRVGLIGHFVAAGAEAGTQMLRHACAELARCGRTLAIGPMDGSTNRAYRLVTEGGEEPPFFLEPENPPEWPAAFAAAGFAPLATYCSSLQARLDHADPGIPVLAAAFAAEGVSIRPFDMEQFEEELRRIYAIVALSFQHNFLATTIAEGEFLMQYRPIKPYIRPELVLLAERGAELVGFIFLVPDWLQALRGEPLTTVIVKTLAVLPEYAGRGLGTLLSARAEEAARGLGFTRAIHALMHEANTSRKISSRFEGHIIRRYTLFARPLEARA
jgi:GNAT superfamily N-acetyltransferase